MIFYKLLKKIAEVYKLKYHFWSSAFRLIEIPLFLKYKTKSQAKNELHPFYSTSSTILPFFPIL